MTTMEIVRVVNVKELKAKLSAYLREVGRGETFLVTDRDRVVARLGPLQLKEEQPAVDDVVARWVALGARPPLRERRPTDYQYPPGPPIGLTTEQIDALLDWVRGEGEDRGRTDE